MQLFTHRDRHDRLGGRANLYHHDRRILSVNAHAWTDHVLLALELNADEPSIRLALAAGPYLSIDVPIPRQLRERLAARLLRGLEHHDFDDVDVVRVSVHHGGLWWSICHTSDSRSRQTPRWRHGRWNVVDQLLGERTVDRTLLSETEVDVPLQEGTYRWRIRLEETRLSRARWRTEVLRTFEAEPARPGQQIPTPGKGENSWDCGPDALFGLSGQAGTLDEAVARIVAAVLRNRLRYGGKLTYGPESPEGVAA